MTIARDLDGNGLVDQSELRVTNADSSRTLTVTDLNADGSVRDRTVSTTSLDGLNKLTKTDLTGSGLFDQTRSDVTVQFRRAAGLFRHGGGRPDGMRQINPTGKISLNTSGKSILRLTPSCPRGRGVGHRHRTLGWDCGGRSGIVRAMGSQGGINSVSGSRDVQTSDVEAYGKIVWT